MQLSAMVACLIRAGIWPKVHARQAILLIQADLLAAVVELDSHSGEKTFRTLLRFECAELQIGVVIVAAYTAAGFLTNKLRIN